MLHKLCKKTNAVDIPENIREAISCFATNFSIEICEEIYGKILKNYKLLFVFLSSWQK